MTTESRNAIRYAVVPFAVSFAAGLAGGLLMRTGLPVLLLAPVAAVPAVIWPALSRRMLWGAICGGCYGLGLPGGFMVGLGLTQYFCAGAGWSGCFGQNVMLWVFAIEGALLGTVWGAIAGVVGAKVLPRPRSDEAEAKSG